MNDNATLAILLAILASQGNSVTLKVEDLDRWHDRIIDPDTNGHWRISPERVGEGRINVKLEELSHEQSEELRKERNKEIKQMKAMLRQIVNSMPEDEDEGEHTEDEKLHVPDLTTGTTANPDAELARKLGIKL